MSAETAQRAASQPVRATSPRWYPWYLAPSTQLKPQSLVGRPAAHAPSTDEHPQLRARVPSFPVLPSTRRSSACRGECYPSTQLPSLGRSSEPSDDGANDKSITTPTDRDLSELSSPDDGRGWERDSTDCPSTRPGTGCSRARQWVFQPISIGHRLLSNSNSNSNGVEARDENRSQRYPEDKESGAAAPGIIKASDDFFKVPTSANAVPTSEVPLHTRRTSRTPPPRLVALTTKPRTATDTATTTTTTTASEAQYTGNFGAAVFPSSPTEARSVHNASAPPRMQLNNTQPSAGAVVGADTSELSLADVYRAQCRRLGLKQPNAQVLRQLPQGTAVGDDVNELVEYLDFRDTYLGPRGCLAVSAVFAHCPNLKAVYLAASGLSGSTAVHLFSTTSCSVAAAAAAAAEGRCAQEVFRALQLCPQLRYLDVSRNALDDAAGTALLQLVLSCPLIRDVNVDETHLSDPLRLKIESILKSRQADDAAALRLVCNPSPYSPTNGGGPPGHLARDGDDAAQEGGANNANEDSLTASSEEGDDEDVESDDRTGAGASARKLQRRVPAFVALGLVELRRRLVRNRHCMQRVYDCFVLPDSVAQRVSMGATALPSHKAGRALTSAEARSLVHLELLGAPLDEATLLRTQQGTCSWKAFFRALRVLGVHSVAKNLSQAIAFASVCGVLCAETVQFGKLINMLRIHAVLSLPCQPSAALPSAASVGELKRNGSRRTRLETGADVLAAYRRQCDTAEVYDSSPFYAKLSAAAGIGRENNNCSPFPDGGGSGVSQLMGGQRDSLVADPLSPLAGRYASAKRGSVGGDALRVYAEVPPPPPVHMVNVSGDCDQSSAVFASGVPASFLPQVGPCNGARGSVVLPGRARDGSISVSCSFIPSMLVSKADLDGFARRASAFTSVIGDSSGLVMDRKRDDADTVEGSRPTTKHEDTDHSVARGQVWSPSNDEPERAGSGGGSTSTSHDTRTAYYRSLRTYAQPTFSALFEADGASSSPLRAVSSSGANFNGGGRVTSSGGRAHQHRRSVTWREKEQREVLESDGLAAPISEVEVQFVLDRLYDARHALRNCLRAVAESTAASPRVPLTGGGGGGYNVHESAATTTTPMARPPSTDTHLVLTSLAHLPSPSSPLVATSHASVSEVSRGHSQGGLSSASHSPLKSRIRLSVATPAELCACSDNGAVADDGQSPGPASYVVEPQSRRQPSGGPVCHWPIIEAQALPDPADAPQHQPSALASSRPISERGRHTVSREFFASVAPPSMVDDVLSSVRQHSACHASERRALPSPSPPNNSSATTTGTTAASRIAVGDEPVDWNASHHSDSDGAAAHSAIDAATDSNPSLLVPMESVYAFCVAIVGSARQGVLQCVFNRCGLSCSDGDALVDVERDLISKLKLRRGAEKASVLPEVAISPVPAHLRRQSATATIPAKSATGTLFWETIASARGVLLETAASRPLAAEEAARVWRCLTVKELQRLIAPF